ncbi:MAG: ATP phosphoribosyltransferase [Candidatus Omnitrophica bacterium]|nr:ATP phosphoribosyltransferase [Candidatus Omnitrophota bacterium]
MKLKLGIPKGSLQESTIKMFKKAGFDIKISERSYMPYIDDPDIDPILLRAQEMSEYVENGTLDCGITGNDWIMEKGSKVQKVAELVYAKRGIQPVRWVLAVRAGSGIKSVKDLKNGRIATELVSVTKKYLKKNKVKAQVDFSWGATEIKANMELVDAIVELTETGSSLRANNLRIIDTICESTTQFITNKDSYKNAWKREKMNNIAMLLKGAIVAENKVGLKMNVSKKDLNKVLKILPAMKRPTISSLTQAGWVDVDTILDEKTVKNIIPKLKKAGAQGLVEYPLNKVIY